MPSWFSVSVAQVGVGAGVGVAAVVQVQVESTTKGGAVGGSAVDSPLLISVLQHLVLLVPVVFQGEQERAGAVCRTAARYKNKKDPERCMNVDR